MGDLINTASPQKEKEVSSKTYGTDVPQMPVAADPIIEYMSRPQLEKSIARTRKLMTEAAKRLDFIEAAQYRDELLKLEDIIKSKEQ